MYKWASITIEFVDFKRHYKSGRYDVESFEALLLLHSLHVFVKTVFSRELAGARKMVNFLVLLEASESVGFQVVSRPDHVELGCTRMTLEREETGHSNLRLGSTTPGRCFTSRKP